MDKDIKVYLEAEWVDGTDYDYHSFDLLEDCADYIKKEGIETFNISTTPINVDESEYTHHKKGE